MEPEESDLYGLPLGEFIPARTALERRLRREGEREWAAAVKKLPKPSVAAWAVNQASRSQPKHRRELLTASAALRDAQERLMAGDASPADLEKAAKRQRAAIEALTDAASGLLTDDGKGLGEATLARVRETLAAVATDDELAPLVESGTLDRERHPAGLGFGFELGDPAPEPRGKGAGKRGGSGRETPKKESAKGRKQREKDEKRRQKAKRAAREAAKAAKEDEREAAKRQKAAERGARKAAEALERAERAADEAREAAQSARQELDAASAAQRDAAGAREAAEGELDRHS